MLEDYGHYIDNCQDEGYFPSWKIFTIDIVGEIRVLGVYTHRTKSQTIEEAPMNHNSMN
jgi:hypothetical protein